MTDASERRHAPRYEVIAQANVGSGDEAYLMPVRNISSSGLFLEGNPAEHPELRPGADIEIVLSASAPGAADDEVANVRCRARVARVEPSRAGRLGGFGLTIEPASKDDAVRMRALLGRAAHVPPPRPASLHG
jgi:hypothetical protein